MSQSVQKIGIIGAGYIADWHAEAIKACPDAKLVAVCDQSSTSADAFGAKYGVQSFYSVDDLISSNSCDAVHILTPPSSHKALGVQCLDAGLTCFIEKPFALSVNDAKALNKAAAGGNLGVGHNFLGLPSYERMKAALRRGDLGRVASADINWNLPLAPLRSGPFGLWLLREPKNLLLELGPHLMAFAVDLFGAPKILHTIASNPIELSGGGTRYQSWKIIARAGDVDLTFNINLVETMDDRSVTLRGSSAIARLNYAKDTLVMERDNAADIVANPFVYQGALAWQNIREGSVNLARHVTSLNRKSPYGLSFSRSIDCFYSSVARGRPIDARFSGASAQMVSKALDDAIKRAPKAVMQPDVVTAPSKKPKPSVMVIGGTGFIGRSLTRDLVSRGRDVRVFSRGSNGPFGDIAGNVEVFSGSLHSADDLARAMRGIDVVYHLAKSVDDTWEDCLQNDVGVSVKIAQAAIDAGVNRFIYTGTIASFDMSEPSQIIRDDTPFDDDMSDRNLYARSKAACEAALLDLHDKQGLPLVIARPGIVLGKGGPLQHWGIGRWQGAGTVRIWGDGHNKLPFVLIDDVCDGLIRMIDTDDALGKAFNLVGAPMMTARDYFAAIQSELGARIVVKSGWLPAFFGVDAVKYVLKRHALGRKQAVRASLKDWKSRAHYTPFDISQSQEVLGWTPIKDRAEFVKRAIVEADLFGF